MTDLARYQDPLTIQRVLHTAGTIAIVGLSGNELRASYCSPARTDVMRWVLKPSQCIRPT